MGILDEGIRAFLASFDKDCEGELGVLQRDCYDKGIPIISRDIATFLSALLSMKKPARVLEIGCAVGFSASLFAQFLDDGGKVTTIDRYEVLTARAKENFEKLGLADKIELIEEDAATALPQLLEAGESYDFIFMDCGKGQYMRFFPYIVKLLKVGGLFCADDIFQDGTIARNIDEIAHRQRTIHRNLKEFLQIVMSDGRLKSVILPIGDGLLLSTKERN